MARPSWFQRFLLPGFAFKAVVIGGGYATGRELAEFFVSVGPRGGVARHGAVDGAVQPHLRRDLPVRAHASAARTTGTSSATCSGRSGSLFEAAYMFSFILILAVYGAAAGAIGVGDVRLAAARGRAVPHRRASRRSPCSATASVEWLFKYASFFLYGVYALFVFFTLRRFGAEARQGFAAPAANDGWVTRRRHVHRLQRPRRRGDPAGPAPPDQHAGRRHCRPARGTARDDRGRCSSSCA